MFNEVNVPVLGVVENMSYFDAGDGKRVAMFGTGGGQKLALEAGVELLGELPIDPRVAECGDNGEPMVAKYPDSEMAAAYKALALRVMDASARAASSATELPAVEL